MNIFADLIGSDSCTPTYLFSRTGNVLLGKADGLANLWHPTRICKSLQIACSEPGGCTTDFLPQD